MGYLSKTLITQPVFLFKVNNGNNRSMFTIYSKLIIKIIERQQWPHSRVFIVNFDQILHVVLVLTVVYLE